METIPERIAVQAESTRSLINEKWDFAGDKADQAFLDAIAAINTLASIGTPSVDHPEIDWDDIEVDFSISVTKPDLPTITYNAPTTKPTIGTIKDYPDIEFPLSLFNVFNTANLQSIKDKLAAGGTGLGAAAEEALWDRARGRNEAKNEAAYNETLNFFAARGFDLPPGALAGRLSLVQTEIMRSETDLNNDILVAQADLTQKNDQFISELAFKTASEYPKNVISMISDQNKSVVEVFATGMEGYKTDVLAETSRVDALSKVVNALLDMYKTDASVQGIIVDAKGKEVDAKIKQQLAEQEVLLKGTEIDIELAKFVWSTQVETYKAIATIASQLAASAMAAVNASVSTSYGASSSEGTSYSDNTSTDATKEVKSITEQFIHQISE